MLQRIQTIYLIIVTMLAIFGCVLPIVNFDNESIQQTLTAWSLTTVMPSSTIAVSTHFWGLFAMSLVMPVMSFVTIWLYHKRMLQIRLCILNILFMLGYYAILGVCIWQVTSKFNAVFMPQLAAIFPLINIILTWLAIRGIGKDEAKVRAADRIRR